MQAGTARHGKSKLLTRMMQKSVRATDVAFIEVKRGARLGLRGQVSERYGSTLLHHPR